MEQMIFGDYNQLFLLLNEESHIYKDDMLTQVYDSAIKYSGTVVNSVETKLINGVPYHYIMANGRMLGWIKLEESIQVFRNKPVYLKRFSSEPSELERLDIKGGYEISDERKVYIGRSHLYHDGKLFTSLFIRDKFYGFLPMESYDLGEEISIESEFADADEIFLNSGLSSKYAIEDPVVKVTLLFRELNLARIRADRKTLWTPISNLREVPEKKEISFEQNMERSRQNDYYLSFKEEKKKLDKVMQALEQEMKKVERTEEKSRKLEDSHNELESRISELEKENQILRNENSLLISELDKKSRQVEHIGLEKLILSKNQ